MFTLYVKESFSAAHRLENYNGKCEELHGHNFVVEALFEGEKPGTGGILVDFKVLKRFLREILDSIDHKYLNDIPFFREKASSSEFIAMYIYRALKKSVENERVFLKEVRVWESDSAYAAYGE